MSTQPMSNSKCDECGGVGKVGTNAHDWLWCPECKGGDMNPENDICRTCNNERVIITKGDGSETEPCPDCTPFREDW